MRDIIIETAKKNTEINSANAADLHLLKLKSIKDLDCVKDLMCEWAAESLDDKENRKWIRQDIKDGITFIFWYDQEGKLEYSR
ncbi:hypothetical protein [Paenibacillus naphthalenovorans]|uniref:Uncharacterized protein n=1 Tax=Paenibacillus naphthalenovorans TaxID=162209 RepID=A0A0U2VF82_9BACL|nr:hypothetical protein [Paenibacillus naphthalenovorans]ALS22179.1 hypothetical protein IJ22_18050 [Paenibacillus naphthalenovorans]